MNAVLNGNPKVNPVPALIRSSRRRVCWTKLNKECPPTLQTEQWKSEHMLLRCGGKCTPKKIAITGRCFARMNMPIVARSRIMVHAIAAWTCLATFAVAVDENLALVVIWIVRGVSCEGQFHGSGWSSLETEAIFFFSSCAMMTQRRGKNKELAKRYREAVLRQPDNIA